MSGVPEHLWEQLACPMDKDLEFADHLILSRRAGTL